MIGGMIMKWLDNMVTLWEKGMVGKCPYCKSDNTDYNATIIQDDMGFILMWCNDCKKGFNISRAKITSNLKTNNKPPKDISL